MTINIIKGEFKGKTAELIQQTIGTEYRLCGDPTTDNSVTVLVEGMLYPVQLSLSDLEPNATIR